MTIKHTIFAVALGLFCLPASADESKCKVYTSSVNWTGVGKDIYVNTSLYACIAKGKDDCDSKGGMLCIRNSSSTHYAKVTTALAGLHDHRVDPKTSEVHTLAVYRTPGGPNLKGEMTVFWCPLK